ncbi:AMP-dependent synthetase/ligase [Gordonia sp. NPDC058843]|uniref:AMP-dependent synthetase/ligase n=1 Tax=Gordonia sp. NPDC058843 TaxID=3346648 RepID=UPI0036B71688
MTEQAVVDFTPAEAPEMAPTVCAAFQRTVELHADRTAFRTRGDGRVVTWHEYGQRVEQLAAGLAGLGVKPGDTIATQLHNCIEFFEYDMAAVHIGAVPFGIYNTSSPAQIVDRLTNADCAVLITEQQFLPAVRDALNHYDGIRHLIVIDSHEEGVLSTEDVIAAASEDFSFDAAWRSVMPDDLVTVIYTSGTTGPPKGAQWSHNGVMSMLRSWAQVIPLPTRAVSYLPMAHAGERMLTHYMPLGRGATVTTCPSYQEVLAHVQESHPDFLATVPRTWVKLRSAIQAQIDGIEDAGEREAVQNALAVGLERVGLDQRGEAPSGELVERHEAAKRLLNEKILAPWGLDNLKAAFIGSAPPPQDVIVFFLAMGVPLLEAYGLTEATAFGACWPRLNDFKIGTVGKPLPGVEVRIAEDGEVLLRSPMNMVGYRKEPDASATTLDEDNWLHTGDVGWLDEDGFLKVIDRKKELLITATGKNMSPSNIEAEVKKANTHIAQVVAVGDGRPYLVALLTIDTEGAAALAAKHGIEDVTVAAVSQHPAVRSEFQAAVDEANRNLSRVENIKKFTILPDEWTPDSHTMTPTMKLKRKPIAERYAEAIEALYAG